MTRGRLTNHNTSINFKGPINPRNEVGIRHSKRGNFVKTSLLIGCEVLKTRLSANYESLTLVPRAKRENRG